jgi:hypothetical protein
MMPPNSYEVMKAVLSAMADTEDISWIFYIIAVFQIATLLAGISKRVRANSVFLMLVAVSQLALPILLAFGVYFSLQPPA